MKNFIITRRNREAGYLTFVNVFTSFIGFLVGLYNARLLGPDAYGIIAVISGINIVVLNFLDIRLTDLAGKLYFQEQGRSEVDYKNYRSSVLGLCLIGNGIISAVLFLLGLIVNFGFIHFFTKTSVRWEWIAMQTLAVVLGNWANTFYFLQRFSNRFYIIGTWRLISQLLMSLSMVSLISIIGGLNGYYSGQLVGYLLYFLTTVFVSFYIWIRLERFPPLFKHFNLALKDYLKNIRFIVMGNFLGYAKLMHRGGDILLVSFFTDDRRTGLYNLARSLTNSLYILFDSLNQVYSPHFLELLSKNNYVSYRKLAVFFILGTIAFTIGIIICEILFFPWMNEFLLQGRFNGIEEILVILTIPFLFVTGFYLWYWPIFIFTGKIGSFVSVNGIAAIAQYGVTIFLIKIIGLDSASGAFGYLTYEILVTVGALFILSKRRMEIFPNAYRPGRV